MYIERSHIPDQLELNLISDFFVSKNFALQNKKKIQGFPTEIQKYSIVLFEAVFPFREKEP